MSLPPADGRDVAAGRHALAAGHDDHIAPCQPLLQFIGMYREDVGLGVVVVRLYPGLSAGEEHAFDPLCVQLVGQHRTGDNLSAGVDHVLFPVFGQLLALPVELEQGVGGVRGALSAHGGDHHNELFTLLPGLPDDGGGGLSRALVRHRGPAKF